MHIDRWKEKRRDWLRCRSARHFFSSFICCWFVFRWIPNNFCFIDSINMKISFFLYVTWNRWLARQVSRSFWTFIHYGYIWAFLHTAARLYSKNQIDVATAKNSTIMIVNHRTWILLLLLLSSAPLLLSTSTDLCEFEWFERDGIRHECNTASFEKKIPIKRKTDTHV